MKNVAIKLLPQNHVFVIMLILLAQVTLAQVRDEPLSPSATALLDYDPENVNWYEHARNVFRENRESDVGLQLAFAALSEKGVWQLRHIRDSETKAGIDALVGDVNRELKRVGLPLVDFGKIISSDEYRMKWLEENYRSSEEHSSTKDGANVGI